MSGKNPSKRVYKPKKAITKCGYCSKDENLENLCKTVHSKSKLTSGQKTMDDHLKNSKLIKETGPTDNLPDQFELLFLCQKLIGLIPKFIEKGKGNFNKNAVA